jgi:hypothetical protein
MSERYIEAVIHPLDSNVETKKAIRMPGGYRLIFVSPKNAIVRIVEVVNG